MISMSFGDYGWVAEYGIRAGGWRHGVCVMLRQRRRTSARQDALAVKALKCAQRRRFSRR